MYQERPHHKPEDPESSEDVEDGVPAYGLAQVAAEGHRYDGTKGRAGVGECSESRIFIINFVILLPTLPPAYLLLSWGVDQRAIMASMAGKVTPSPSPSTTLIELSSIFTFQGGVFV